MMSRSSSNYLRAVTLDLWQTLTLDRPELGHVRSLLRIDGTFRVLVKEGVTVTREQVEQAYRRNADAHWKMQEEARDISFEQQVEDFLRCIDPALSPWVTKTVLRLVGERYAGPFLAYPPGLAPGARQVLETLKSRGYRLAIISNTGMTPGRMFRNYLTDLGILHYFDALIFSDETGLSKPAPGIFQQTLDALDVEARHATHVGDSPCDVAGAKAVGMGAIWLRVGNSPQPSISPDTTITRLWELPTVL